MNDFMSVAVLDGAKHLLEEAPSLIFRHLAFLDDIIEEFSSGVL